MRPAMTSPIRDAPHAASALTTGSPTNLWLPLIWKEWHEHKWKSAWMTTLCCLSVVLAGGARADMGIATVLSLAGALFLAMGVAAGEREDGTWAFASSLPIQRWKIGGVRMAVAGVLCIVPVLGAAVVIQIMMLLMGHGESSSELWLSAFVNCGLCLSLFYWVTAAASGQPTQLRAGLIGMFVVLGWFAAVLVLQMMRNQHGATWVEKTAWIGPGGWLMLSDAVPGWSFLLFESVSTVVLIAISIAAYGLSLERPRKTPSKLIHSLGPVRPSPRNAIAWLHVRETIPLCAAGTVMLIALGIGASVSLSNNSRIIEIANTFETTALVVGIPWLVVIAVGTFTPSLSGGLHAFWRSRPIEVGNWYWSKFWIGAAVSLVSIHLPVLVLLGATQQTGWRANCLGYFLSPLVHLMAYSLGVLAAVAIRQVVHAGVMSMAIAILLVGIPAMPESSLSFLRYQRARNALTEFVSSGLDTATLAGFLPLLVLTLVITAASAFAGAIIVRTDWCVSGLTFAEVLARKNVRREVDQTRSVAQRTAT